MQRESEYLQEENSPKFKEKENKLVNVCKICFSIKLFPTSLQNATKYFPTGSCLTLHKVKFNHPNDTNIGSLCFAPNPLQSKTSPADTNLY